MGIDIIWGYRLMSAGTTRWMRLTSQLLIKLSFCCGKKKTGRVEASEIVGNHQVEAYSVHFMMPKSCKPVSTIIGDQQCSMYDLLSTTNFQTDGTNIV